MNRTTRPGPKVDVKRAGTKATETAGKARKTFRRRLDNLLLRWQARLDSEWSDRVLPWAFAFGLFVILELLSFARARSLDGTINLAGYTQGAWLIQNGHEPTLTITTGTNVLASQATFIFYPIAWFTNLVPIQATLLLTQSAALAVAVVPLWRIARTLANLRAGTTLVLLIVYGLYPTMHSLNLAGFHPETIALPLILFAAYFGLSRHWRRYLVCCALIVICRADFGLVVAGLGGLVWFEGNKPEGKATFFGGIAYTLIAISVVQPYFADGAYIHINAFHAFGDTPLTAGWGMVTHPADVLGAVFRERNFNVLVTLLAPVAFLPFLAPKYLLPVLPLQFFFFVSDVPQTTAYAQLTIPITAFIFLATCFALTRVGRMGVEKVIVDRRVLAVMLLAATIFFVRDAASSPYRSPWGWGGRDAIDAARLAAADLVGPDRPVRASASVLTVLSERRLVFELDTSGPDAMRAGSSVDAVVLDIRTTMGWTAADRQAFRQGLEAQGFRLVSQSEGIELYLRGPPP